MCGVGKCLVCDVGECMVCDVGMGVVCGVCVCVVCGVCECMVCGVGKCVVCGVGVWFVVRVSVWCVCVCVYNLVKAARQDREEAWCKWGWERGGTECVWQAWRLLPRINKSSQNRQLIHQGWSWRL